MKAIKLTLGIILGAFFVWIVFLCRTKTKQSQIVKETLQCNHWQQRAEIIANVPANKYKVVFLGNSLTEMFDVNYYFNDSTLLNAGITGDFSEGLLQRNDAICRLKPKKLFIEIGINDMIEKISLEKICANYEALLIKIQRESPDTKIYIQSNLPVIIRRPSILTSNEDVNNLVIQQNKNLQQIAQKYHCTYIDIYTEMMKEKNLEILFIPDGIHLTPHAYSIWTSIVKPYLDK